MPRVDWVFPPHSTQLSQEPTDKHTGELNGEHPSLTFSFWVIPQCVKVTKKLVTSSIYYNIGVFQALVN